MEINGKGDVIQTLLDVQELLCDYVETEMKPNGYSLDDIKETIDDLYQVTEWLKFVEVMEITDLRNLQILEGNLDHLLSDGLDTTPLSERLKDIFDTEDDYDG